MSNRLKTKWGEDIWKVSLMFQSQMGQFKPLRNPNPEEKISSLL